MKTVLLQEESDKKMHGHAQFGSFRERVQCRVRERMCRLRAMQHGISAVLSGNN